MHVGFHLWFVQRHTTKLPTCSFVVCSIKALALTSANLSHSSSTLSVQVSIYTYMTMWHYIIIGAKKMLLKQSSLVIDMTSELDQPFGNSDSYKTSSIVKSMRFRGNVAV